jgi:two-component system, NarL family, nitrate/nitrite response regulator NarL
MTRSIDVVIAAPHPLMLAGLRSLLEPQRDIAILSACSSYAVMLRTVKRLRPAVLVADATIIEPGDREPFARLQAVCPGLQVAVIAQWSPSRANGPTTGAGIAAILSRDVGPERLIQCVKALADGRPCATVPARATARATREAPSARGRSPLALLTFREREIAQGVARGKRNKEIAEAFGIAPGTVKLHLHRIYAKLGVNSRLALFKKLAEEAQPRTER